MISGSHPNRQAHNWLIYDIGDRFLEEFGPLFRGVLFDLGAGEAPYREFFLRHAERYVTVDWANSLHPVRPDVVADLNVVLPIPRDAADSVVSVSVLEHLHEPQTMVSEAFRILKSGGHFVLQVPWQWSVHEAPHDYYRFTPYALRLMFERAGFADVNIRPQAGFATTLVLKVNYFTRRLVGGRGPVRGALTCVMSLFWFAGQKLAPWLDRLDRDWMLESCGFFVTARKP